MTHYNVSEIYGTGEDFPVPGPAIWSGEASDAIDALSRYAIAEGFAPYERLPEPILGHAGYGVRDPFEPMADYLSDGWETPQAASKAAEVEANVRGYCIPYPWNDAGTIASSPFTNTEVMAYTDEAIA